MSMTASGRDGLIVDLKPEDAAVRLDGNVLA